MTRNPLLVTGHNGLALASSRYHVAANTGPTASHPKRGARERLLHNDSIHGVPPRGMPDHIGSASGDGKAQEASANMTSTSYPSETEAQKNNTNERSQPTIRLTDRSETWSLGDSLGMESRGHRRHWRHWRTGTAARVVMPNQAG